MSTPRVLTPSQFTALARSVLEDSFPLVEIEGELTNVSRPASGHLYFGLKDRAAQVRCAMFRPRSQWLKFRPADGDQVLVRGRATLYEPRGDFQLLVEHLAPAGEGALRAAFEALRARLDAEGLFDPTRKRPIPRWISRLCVLSSPQGAAIHDVLSVLRRRFPLIAVDLVPVPVQGSEAAGRIIDALQKIDRAGRHDVILLTRGGGSIEDLAAFNDEALARAIFASRTPLVAAVGHEVDISIAELVADLRAPTPSVAAEALSPDQADLRQRVARLADTLRARIDVRSRVAAQRLDQAHARLRQQHPALRLQRHGERLQGLADRLQRAQAARSTWRRELLRSKAERLRGQYPQRRLAQLRKDCHDARRALQSRMQNDLGRQRQRVQAILRTLQAVAPQATLQRGYAIVLRPDGRIVASVAAVAADERLAVRLADGSLQVQVARIEGPHDASR